MKPTTIDRPVIYNHVRLSGKGRVHYGQIVLVSSQRVEPGILVTTNLFRPVSDWLIGLLGKC